VSNSFVIRIRWTDPPDESGQNWSSLAIVLASLFVNFLFWIQLGTLPLWFACAAALVITAALYWGPALAIHSAGSVRNALDRSFGRIPATLL
jgi:hypothetical protein